MAFLTVEFVGFFLVTLAGFYLIPARWQWAWLLAASVVFYGQWSPLLTVHVVAVTAVSYWFAIRIEAATAPSSRGRWTRCGVVLLAANLFLFKYTAFVNDSVRAVFDTAGLAYPVPEFHILLPIGISFYTFQLIGYLVDISKGAKAEHHFGIFALFTLFFAKVVSGPIERSRSLLPQLQVARAFDSDRVADGLRLALWGAFQKLVVADQLAPAVAVAFDAPGQYSGVVMSAATWLFALQIYFDFAGYTNIARGVARTFGYELLQNFNRPYFATSIQDFWKRWHMSLTSWLTDYVYNSLVRIKVRMKWFYWTLCSLLLTFILSGLWHGAGWTFVAWGALHGFYLVISLLSQKWRGNFNRRIGLLKRPKLHARLKMAITFLLVCVAYVFFRADSMRDALHIFSHLHTGWSDAPWQLLNAFDATKRGIAIGIFGATLALTVEAFSAKVPFAARFASQPRWVRWGTCYLGLVATMLLGALAGNGQEFIYVRF